MRVLRNLTTPPGAAYWTDETTAVATTGTSLRVRSLEHTAQIAEGLLEPTQITRIADVTDLDTVGIPVYHSIRPAALPGLNTVTSGKGTSRISARISAVMEAIERRWCEPDVTGLVRASYANLMSSGKRALDPRRLIPRRGHTWDEDYPTTWCPARDLIADEVVLVPALAVFTPFPHEAGLFSSNTMGLAIGNSPSEALLHGLLELIEHDSTAFGETLGHGRRIRLTSLPAEPAALVHAFQNAGLDVDVLSYGNAAGIPSFYVAVQDNLRYDGMLFNGGAGCHPDAEVAVTRALTEAAQSRLNVIGGAREDFSKQAYRRDVNFDSVKRSYDQWRSRFPTVDWEPSWRYEEWTIENCLVEAITALGGAGVDAVYAVELAPHDYPFSVTKAIVPGLEVHHQDKRRLGLRLKRAITENRRIGGDSK